MITKSRFIWLALSMAGLLVACGDDGSTCGDGTVEVGGTCVPTDSVCTAGTTFNEATRMCDPNEVEPPITCGAGTTLTDGICVADGGPTLDCGTGTIQVGEECAPDGSVVCTGATAFDMDSGTCILDESACAEGTVFSLETESCIAFDDSLVPDFRELAEPNDPRFNDAAMAQMVELPEDGPVTFGGCIEPEDFDEDGFPDDDRDLFTIEVDGPTLLNVNADGIGGLTAGLIVLSTDPDLGGWVRAIVDQTSDTAAGQIYLPKAGEYQFLVGDSRNLIPFLVNAFYGRSNTPLPAGGPDACYHIQIETTDIPDATELTDGEAEEGTLGDPQFYSFASDAGLAGIDFTSLVDGEPGGLITVAGSYVVRDADSFIGVGPSAVPVEDGSELLIVVDTAYNVTFRDVDFSLAAALANSNDYPEDDDDVSVTHEGDTPSVTTRRYFTFDGTAGDIAHLEFDGGVDSEFEVVLVTPSGDSITLCERVADFFGTTPGCSDLDEYVRLVGEGSYALGIFNYLADDGEDYSIALSRTTQTPVEIEFGTAVDSDFDDDDTTFFTVDALTTDWLTYGFSMFTSIDDLDVDFYDLVPAEGESSGFVLGLQVPNVDGASVSMGDVVERAYLGEGSRFLIGVSEDGTTEDDEAFQFLVSEPDVTDLGTVDPDTDLTEDDVAIAEDETLRFIFRGTEDGGTDTVTVTGDATLDVVITRLAGGGEVDETGGGEAETFTQAVTIDATPFTVTGNEAGTLDILVTEELPPYEVTASAVAFVSVCDADGAVELVDADDALTDETMLAMGGAFPFAFFGEMKTSFVATTNGWLTFQGDYTDPATFPGFLPFDLGDVVSPQATDMITRICVLRDADTYTIEWDGEEYTAAGSGGAPVAMQVILRTSGVIDFVFGDTHATEGGTVVLRDVDGMAVEGLEIVPGASMTFTPR